MTKLEEASLIEDLKDRFYNQTRKYIKIQYSTKWEAICRISPDPVDFDILCKMVYDATGWSPETVFGNGRTSSRHQAGTNLSLTASEKIYRRSLIDFIAVNNDISISFIGKQTDRHHTTIIHSYSKFEEKVKNSMLYQNILKEIIAFIKTNYYLYPKQ